MAKVNLPLFQTYEEDDKLVRTPVKPPPIATTPVTTKTQTVTPQETTMTETTVEQPNTQPVAAATDNSDYIRQMYQAQTDAALASLKSAYDQNMAQLDRTAAQIPGTYQEARNQAAATSAQSQRNFDQAAAAAGLNSGASAQARLATTVARQNNIGALNTAEANALAEIELQRTSASIEYENAIAQAKANGNYELAAALYQEAIRVDEYLLAQEQAAQASTDTSAAAAQQEWDNYNKQLSLAVEMYKVNGDRAWLDQLLADPPGAESTPTAAPIWGTGYSTAVMSTPVFTGSEWDLIKANIVNGARQGNADSALDTYSAGMSLAQWNEIATALKPYGYNLPTY